jgi:hypothetical protein
MGNACNKCIDDDDDDLYWDGIWFSNPENVQAYVQEYPFALPPSYHNGSYIVI